MGFNISNFIPQINRCKKTLYGQDIYEFYSDAISIYHSILNLFDEDDLNLFDLHLNSTELAVSPIVNDIDNLISFLNSRMERVMFDYDELNNSIKSDLINYLTDLKQFLTDNSSVEKDIDLFIYSFFYYHKLGKISHNLKLDITCHPISVYT